MIYRRKKKKSDLKNDVIWLGKNYPLLVFPTYFKNVKAVSLLLCKS